MPSTDRKLTKSKDIDGSDRLTGGCVCQRVNFPTRISNSLSTTVDNIFIDKIKNKDFSIGPILNGLSDHDAQIIQLHDVDIPTRQIKPSKVDAANYNRG
jgi:hypothetical protein